MAQVLVPNPAGTISQPVLPDGTVSAKAFGAIAGAPAPAAAIQAAVAYASANKIGVVNLGEWVHNFEATVVLTEDVHIQGPGGTAWEITGVPMGHVTPFGCVIRGAAGVTSAFRLDGRGTTYKTMAARFSGIRFEGYGWPAGGTSALTKAVLSKLHSAPARPIEYDHCQFYGLDDAIYAELSAGQTTGNWVYIHNNVFFVCTNAVSSNTLGLNAYTGFYFRDNVSEQGGRIDIQAGGPVVIEGNLLEGQNNPVKIRGGLVDVSLRSNYYEANAGYIFDIEATNPASTVTVREESIMNSTMVGYLSGVRADIDQRGLIVEVANLSAGTKLPRGQFRYKTGVSGAAAPYDHVLFDPIAGLPDATTPSGSTTVYAPAPGTTSSAKAPWGSVTVGSVTNGWSPDYTVPAMTLSAGQQAVVSAFIRSPSGGVIGWEFKHTGGNLTGWTQRDQLDAGRWYAIAIPYRQGASNSGNLGFRWHADPGVTLEFSDISIAKVGTAGLLSWARP